MGEMEEMKSKVERGNILSLSFFPVRFFLCVKGVEVWTGPK
jgi:hypothetical protein